MRERKPLPLLENLIVTDISAEGHGVARHEEMVVFVEGGVPGDVVDVQLFKKKKNFAEGKISQIKESSIGRIEPFCKHFGTCGGCKWQHLSYEYQLKYKHKQVVETLSRIGKVDVSGISDIIASSNTTYYRNKLEFTCSNSRWLLPEEIHLRDEAINLNAIGFHIPRKFDRVLDIEHCYLQPSPSNEIRLAVKQYADEHGIAFFDLRKQEGWLRTVIVRNTTIGELMVVVVVTTYEEDQLNKLLQHLADKFPQITSLLYVINSKKNDTIFDLDVHTYKGNGFIIEEMEGLKFKVSPKSFYQTNPTQAYELYKVTRDFAALTGNEIVYDLYTGTGTIANFVAKQAKQLIGVEYVPDAIKDAHENSVLNGISNTSFFAGDMKDMLTHDFIAKHGQPDVIITDPPRAGMHEGVVKMMLEVAPKRIVYVSCNPATQARDLLILSEKYSVDKIQPVDMFPHTTHVENVVQLNLKV